MSHCKVFEPQSEIAALKKRVELLERMIEEIRNPPVWGSYPKWCPPAQVGDQYWLGAPWTTVAH